jgi:hypothetical protein
MESLNDNTYNPGQSNPNQVSQQNVPVSPSTQPTSQTLSQEDKNHRTLVTVLLLIFVFPVGWIVMWFYSKWPVWVKLLVSLVALPVVLVVVAILAGVILAVVNPKAQMNKAQDAVTYYQIL